MDSSEKCLWINQTMPPGGLFTSTVEETHPDSHVPWRISPEPFWLSSDEVEWFEELGGHLLKFYQACHLLYSQSLRGIEPGWIAAYLNQGKPDELLRLSRMNRFKNHLPGVIRPDVIPTEDGMIISELDSVPGGMGFTANLARQYTQLDYPIIGGSNGMLHGFTQMIQSVSDRECPTVAIVVSEEASDYRSEMEWFAQALRCHACLYVHTVSPEDLVFTEEGLWIQKCGQRIRVDVVYRFYELFDLHRVPKSELIAYSMKRGLVAVTPPYKPHLEEKLLFALFHHPALSNFWRRYLGKASVRFLRDVLPETWVVDPTELPPHAIIPGLTSQGSPIQNWGQLKEATKKERELVLKPSGFSELAWGSRGVAIGHDMSGEEWGTAIEQALESFGRTPYLMQRFHKGRRYGISYYDFDTKTTKSMQGRARLCPYYLVAGDKARLAGILATICPADKKILHGMIDAVMVPCALAHPV